MSNWIGRKVNGLALLDARLDAHVGSIAKRERALVTNPAKRVVFTVAQTVARTVAATRAHLGASLAQLLTMLALGAFGAFGALSSLSAQASSPRDASKSAATAMTATAAQAATADASTQTAFTLHGEWRQGRLIFGHTNPQARVVFNGRTLTLTPHGDFVLGLDRDAPADAELRVTPPGAAEIVQHYAVAAQQWDVQRIDGLPPAQVNPPPETAARIAREQTLLAAAHASDTPLDDFLQKPQWPARGRVSGIFGSQRILNGTPKAAHYGVDVAVPIGTPVHAALGGVVSLAEPDLYFTGGTLVIDHGHGVSSIMVHLSKLLVKVGDSVKQGEVVAASGMTGRATGPHLHFGVYWFDQHIDPQTLLPPMPSSAAVTTKTIGRR